MVGSASPIVSCGCFGIRTTLDFLMSMFTKLTAGMQFVYGANQLATVTDELAAAFKPGDRLVVLQKTGDLLHIPAAAWEISYAAVGAAALAFTEICAAEDDQISLFYEAFARRLEDDAVFLPVAVANEVDVATAKELGRTVTRLALTEKMRMEMIAGLRMWRDSVGGRGEVIETIHHEGWRAEVVRAGLGVIGFVFEGRPNVFADAAGVVRGGNTVVFRIGSDALGTAQAIVEQALGPALAEAGLPRGTVSLVATASRAAGWAMFSDERLSLAVARGSGRAVAQLGAVARQIGTPVSLHGTGGAWIVAGSSADPEKFSSAVVHSLDRKVCNTLNTCCIHESRADDLVPVFLAALRRIEKRKNVFTKLHVAEKYRALIPSEWFEERPISRASGDVVEPQTSTISEDLLGHEWEWEESPEVTLTIVPDIDSAVGLFNGQSPKFAASLIAEEPAEHDRFFKMIDSPFVGNGMTRWVDGQYALNRPELGLSNWQSGRLFGRGGILSGDSAYTLRMRAIQDDPELRR